MYRRRAQPAPTRLLAILCAVVLAVMLAGQQSWSAGVRGVAMGLMAPIQEGVETVAGQVGRVASVLGDISALRAENARLQQSNATLRSQLVQLSAAAEENAALRQALSFEQSTGHKAVAAAVIGRGPDPYSPTLEIDRGTADGVLVGMAVVTGAGLLGTIAQAWPHEAIIQTLSDPSSRVAIYLLGSDLEGTLRGGQGGLAVQLTLRAGTDAATGDWALTSGLGGALPRGLVVGQVAAVGVSSPGAATQPATVAWVNDPSQVAFVLVITDFRPS